jgi:hypothetical protein
LLLDEEFLNAYQHGMVIECCDGATRRFYPRIFTYSADYQEKYVPLKTQWIFIFFFCNQVDIGNFAGFSWLGSSILEDAPAPGAKSF